MLWGCCLCGVFCFNQRPAAKPQAKDGLVGGGDKFNNHKFLQKKSPYRRAIKANLEQKIRGIAKNTEKELLSMFN